MMMKLLFCVFLLLGSGATEAENNARDPFVPLATKWSGLPDRPLLQQFELSQLDVTGVMYGTREPRVLFKDPSGLTHIATVNNKIGKLGGSIVKIEKNSVVIREDVTRLDGSAETRFISMPLK
ncbi:MAG: hypothetical protein A3F16_04440 [Deltaproteobacteria bacterium RIFCSPHIGHO2_12_FULL_43_9]|nr:MAG: hypothetical protein A3F16_04440 [Deltaproteobacteria bacterium RIFCSPHIGHO2_12_FULL_43_9]